MSRSCIAVLALLVAVSTAVRPTQAASGALVSRAEAARHGLTRAWFTQIRIDPARAKVTHIRLASKTEDCPDTVFVQTSSAMVHALAAETGETLWIKMVGHPDHPSMALGANDELVSVVNGTTLYVLRRTDGRLLWSARIDGVPVAGVVMSDRRAVVPMINGQLASYRLKKTKAVEDDDLSTPKDPASAGAAFELQQQYVVPLSCLSFGRITSHPIVMGRDDLGDFVGWTTTKGLFVGRVEQTNENEFTLVFQITTAGEIVAPPTYLAPEFTAEGKEGILFAASENGQIFAVSARKGTGIWKYSIGEPILQPVVPIGKNVHVAAQLGGIYCFEAETGKRVWWSKGVMQFVAASNTRLYATTKAGDIRVLDLGTGSLLDTLPASQLPLKYLNTDTDRIYVATKSGLVQCFHEVELTEPLRHRELRKPEAVPTPPEQPAGESPAAQPDQPAAGPPAVESPKAPASAAADNPFEDAE